MDFSNRMLVAAMCASFLQAVITQILLAFQTIMFVFLTVFFTQWKRINFIKFLQLMVTHDSACMVLFRAIIAKMNILINTINFCPLVLAIHTLEVILSKLLLSTKCKSDLVFYSIVVNILEQEVVLEGIFLNLTLY
jgi:hypothetical protein